jgi:hypothetical protein
MVRDNLISSFVFYPLLAVLVANCAVPHLPVATDTPTPYKAIATEAIATEPVPTKLAVSAATLIEASHTPVATGSPTPFAAAVNRPVRTKVAGSANTLIEYWRTGGFAGLDDHLIINQDGSAILNRAGVTERFTLDEESLDQLQQLFSGIDFSSMGQNARPPSKGADLFEYSLYYQGYEIRVVDTAIPQALQPIIRKLNEIVEIGE